MPATGWINNELFRTSRCHYVAVFPGALILFNSLLSTIPITIVAILYSIILVQALKNLKNIKLTEKSVKASLANLEPNEKPKLRIYRGNTKTANNSQSIKLPTKTCFQLKRSASFNTNDNNNVFKQTGISVRSKSNDDLNISTTNSAQTSINSIQTNSDGHQSNFSVYTIQSNYSNENSLVEKESPSKEAKCNNKTRKTLKVKGPNKWRAVTVVMLTSMSFIITWMPFFSIVIIFVFCEEKLTNPKCVNLRALLAGPLAALAFLNSVLNPMIYAWWHKGFQKSIKSYFRKYCQRYLFKR